MDDSAACGNSSTAERLALIDELLKLVSPGKIEALVADREFVGEAWFKGLKARHVRFIMRIKGNTRITSEGEHALPRRVTHILKSLKFTSVPSAAGCSVLGYTSLPPVPLMVN